MKKRVLPLVTGLIFIVVLGSWLILNSEDLDKTPDISLNFIDGQKIDIYSLHGKPLLVTFWSITCSTCIKEMPHLVALYNELNKDGFEIIGIAMSYDPPNQVVEFSKRRNVPYLRDPFSRTPSRATKAATSSDGARGASTSATSCARRASWKTRLPSTSGPARTSKGPASPSRRSSRRSRACSTE